MQRLIVCGDLLKTTKALKTEDSTAGSHCPHEEQGCKPGSPQSVVQGGGAGEQPPEADAAAGHFNRRISVPPRPVNDPAHTAVATQDSRLRNRHDEIARELSRYKKSEKKNMDLSKRRTTLSARMMKVREEERTAFARVIHEELGQMLAALQLNVSLLAMENSQNEALIARTAAMKKILAMSINAVQRIASQLRPVMLDQLGLADALEWQAQEFRKLNGISCKTIILLAEKHVDRYVATTVFRIFQEALANVVQHADATHVQVELVERNGWLTLTVRDNGRGISAKAKQSLSSLGIAGMQERTEAVGGRLRIFGSEGRGTALVARIPINREGGTVCPPEY